MRRFLISLLVASALVPAVATAQDRDHRDRGERGAKSDSSSDDRPQRADRQDRPAREPIVRSNQSERPAQAEKVGRTDHAERANRAVQIERPVSEVQVVQPAQPVQQVQTPQRSGNNLVDGFRAMAGQQQAGNGGNHDGGGDHDGDHHGGGDHDGHHWSGDWRHDHRYDWRSYRSSHNSLFRYGRYYDPYGWGYRRFSIGFNLWPSYYGSSFWLNDPWQYRLPPAYGPYRWVRYYNDALLVNIYTGQVVDTVYGFFW